MTDKHRVLKGEQKYSSVFELRRDYFTINAQMKMCKRQIEFK